MCEDMQVTLHDFAAEMRFDVQPIDVDTDPLLVQQYNELVPVLKLGEKTICHHFFDRQALVQALDAERSVN